LNYIAVAALASLAVLLSVASAHDTIFIDALNPPAFKEVSVGSQICLAYDEHLQRRWFVGASLEPISGGPLAQTVHRRGPPPSAMVAPICFDAVKAGDAQITVSGPPAADGNTIHTVIIHVD